MLGDLEHVALVAVREDHPLDPARWAASDFSLIPPIGSTCPVSVISPVIAVSDETARPEISEDSATAIATPAEGPSLGTAPAGTWT